jgi:FkbM family methyltransferase
MRTLTTKKQPAACGDRHYQYTKLEVPRDLIRGDDMKDLHGKRILGGVAKSLLPLVSRMSMNRFSSPLVGYVELGSCMIQGKGTGAGWDIASEVSVASALLKTSTPVLFDVGANYGSWSTQMLKVCPGCLKLVLIEPQVQCLDSLEKITFPNKVIYPCAVSDHQGEMSFFSAEQKRGWAAASLFERRETYFSKIHQRASVVPIRKLDDIIQENDLSRIDFMKIDVEGAELLVLKGAEASLQRRKIKAISFEFGSGNINSRTFFRDFWDFLRSYGFCVARILPGGKMFKIEEYDEDLEYFRGATNYVATL